MTIMMIMIMLFPLSFINYGRGVKVMDAYLGGANLRSSTRFLGSQNQPQDVAVNNYYLRGLIDEAQLARWGALVCWILIAFMMALAFWRGHTGTPDNKAVDPAITRGHPPSEFVQISDLEFPICPP